MLKYSACYVLCVVYTMNRWSLHYNIGGLLVYLFGGYILLSFYYYIVSGVVREVFANSYIVSIFVVLLLALLHVTIYKYLTDTSRDYTLYVFLIVILFVAMMISVFFMTFSSASRIDSMYVVYVDSPVEVIPMRLVPAKTAYAYSTSMITIPTHTVVFDYFSIFYTNNTVYYTFTVEPEYVQNKITKPAYGIVTVTGSHWPPNVTMVSSTFTPLSKIYLLPLISTVPMRFVPEYFTNWIIVDNVHVIPTRDGDVVYYIPVVGWSRTLTTTIPLVEKYIVYEDGIFYDIPATELIDHINDRANEPVLVPIVPEKVAREWIETWKYKNGIIQSLIYNNKPEIRDVGDNPQPYLLPDTNGNLWWVFVLEPSGNTYAVKYIVYVDAMSVTPRILVYEASSTTWIGASKALEYVVAAHPEYNWESFSPEEPLPMIINDTLYWKISIITQEGRGVVSIDVVNAGSGEVSYLLTSSIDGPIDYNIIPALATGSTLDYLGTKAGDEDTVTSRIEAIKKQIRDLIEELEALYEELDRLGNATATTS